jgi:hypothetical protein
MKSMESRSGRLIVVVVVVVGGEMIGKKDEDYQKGNVRRECSRRLGWGGWKS